MKTVILIISIFFTLATNAQNKDKSAEPDKNKKLLLVEASCGQCKFGLHGKSCDLAVRINGKAYFVDGADIDGYGDAHSKHGFCNAVRIAKVQGEIVNDKFKATYFQLMPKGYKKTD